MQNVILTHVEFMELGEMANVKRRAARAVTQLRTCFAWQRQPNPFVPSLKTALRTPDRASTSEHLVLH